MALVVKDRIKVTTSTTGTGTLTLGSAVTKFQDFSVIGDGNTTYYAIESGNGTDWEIGVGTYTASGTTLSRDTILESSNAGSAINLSGTSIVFCTYPAERSVNTADIGSTIQAYDADTAKYDDTTANFVGTLQNGGSDVVVDTDIDSTVLGYVAPGTSGNVLTSNGTTWTSGAVPAPAALSTASGSAPSYSARAWVNFNGTGTVAIRESGNVSSITDNSTGNYTVNLTTAMPDLNYVVVSGAPHYAGSSPIVGCVPATTSTITVLFGNPNPTAVYYDSPQIQLAIFR